MTDYNRVTKLRELNELLRMKIIGSAACTFFAITLGISQALVRDLVGSVIIFTLSLVFLIGQMGFSVSAVKTAVKRRELL
jgi:hypothetical protein